MSLIKRFVRNGERKTVGSVTEGFADGVAVVRDKNNRYLGRTPRSSKQPAMNTGSWSRPNTSDPGLLINRNK